MTWGKKNCYPRWLQPCVGRHCNFREATDAQGCREKSRALILGAKSCIYAVEWVPESYQSSSYLSLKVLFSSLQSSASCTKVPLTHKRRKDALGAPETLQQGGRDAHTLPTSPGAPQLLSRLQSCPTNTDRTEFSKSTADTIMVCPKHGGLNAVACRRWRLHLLHHPCFREASAWSSGVIKTAQDLKGIEVLNTHLPAPEKERSPHLGDLKANLLPDIGNFKLFSQ